MFKKDNKGFTIIEVLIVLAIAGLILLIVFLAVPALQRNSRNTQRTDDVARLLGASQEVLNNNNGQLNQLNDTNLVAAAGDLAYYLPANIAVRDDLSALVAATEETVQIVKGAECNGNTPQTGTARQLAAVFMVEENVARCTDS